MHFHLCFEIWIKIKIKKREETQKKLIYEIYDREESKNSQ